MTDETNNRFTINIPDDSGSQKDLFGHNPKLYALKISSISFSKEGIKAELSAGSETDDIAKLTKPIWAAGMIEYSLELFSYDIDALKLAANRAYNEYVNMQLEKQQEEAARRLDSAIAFTKISELKAKGGKK